LHGSSQSESASHLIRFGAESLEVRDGDWRRYDTFVFDGRAIKPISTNELPIRGISVDVGCAMPRDVKLVDIS
jgi:hypothetical protein